MVGSVLLIGMFIIGLALAGLVTPLPEGVGWGYRFIGWAMILFPIVKWRVVLRGLQKWGKVFVFVLVVVVLGTLFGGMKGYGISCFKGLLLGRDRRFHRVGVRRH